MQMMIVELYKLKLSRVLAFVSLQSKTFKFKSIIMFRKYMSAKTMVMNTVSGWDEDY